MTNYVSRGGDKLAGAHEIFKFDIQDKVALDVGVSTGGFMDFLLKNGARCAMGIDVGYGDVDYQLRIDPRVVLFERTNARLVTRDMLLTHRGWKGKALKENAADLLSDISLVVMDVSFISILTILPAILPLISPSSALVLLVKPQFEAKREDVGPGGIIRDPAIHQSILDRIDTKVRDMGLTILGQCDSPILGTKGNKEFFLYLKKGPC
ncbi:MAG: TlyA family RNA methyltransferase [Candidatus Margulisbacteria bacterium]|nr:TlyA family RNA methyltransferase [Candidatus Margulisiibacteriota bacterium]